MARDYRTKETATLKEAMTNLLKSYKLNRKFAETEIVQSWGRIMGAPIANRTESVFMHQGVLHIKLSSAPLRHELILSKDKVLELLRREYGADAVVDIIFK